MDKGRWSPETSHLMIEAMKRSFVERARHLGDPGLHQDPRGTHHQGIREEARRKIRPHESHPERGTGPEIKLDTESAAAPLTSR